MEILVFIGVATIIIFGGIAIYAFLQIFDSKQRKERKEDAEWKAELAAGGHRRIPTPEEAILEALHEPRDGIYPIPFTDLRARAWWNCDISARMSDKAFWETLKRLESEGKVVRVMSATTTSDSLWALPSTE